MQNNTTLKKITGWLSKKVLIVGLVLCCVNLHAQTISTSTGTNYNGDYSLNNPNALVQTFVIENTNATPRLLTDVSMQMAPYFGNTGASVISLYYSSSSLSGPPSIVSPDWTLIGTGNVTVPAALTDIPVITGLNFTIPANTQYRFAIEATKGLAFSVTPTPTPNIFTVGGVSLKTGDFQIAGAGIGWAGVFPTPNVNNTPTFFGGSVTVNTGLPCAGTPDPGNTISNVTTVCVGTFINLSTQNLTTGTGVTNQWQSSPDGTTWTNIAGATAATLSTTQTAPTYYRVQVTCSGSTGTSTPVQVLLTAQSSCYCLAASTDTDPIFEKIDLVEFGPLTNASTSFDGYENFTSLTPVPSYEAGSTTLLTVTGNANTYGGDVVKVWIDYNQNGSFDDAGEMVYESAQSAGPYSGNITIPATATSGDTRMRIRLFDDVFGNGNNTSCGDNVYGQVEDYTINITPCIPIAVTVQPTDVAITCGDDAIFTLTATGTAIQYQWQVKTSATAAWVNLVNGTNVTGANSATLKISGTDASLSGYQYRVVTSGGCTAVDFSSIATLTVNPVVIVVDPVSYSTCTPIPAGLPVPLSITNVSGGTATTTLTFPSGPLNVTIPDDDPAGIISSITVPALPAGAVITSAKVILNITHPFVGDLSINLKAPNNNIFNLDYLLGATGGDVTTGFTNTEIGSTGVNPLSGGTDPYTGLFRPDAVIAQPAGFPPTGATLIGDANVANFSDLYSTPDGVWTIGMYDAGAIDEGSLVDWTLSITYSVSSADPLTGVWSPVTGLFTDALGTTPYTGTAVTTVYAAPATTTFYTVTVTNATCPSDPVVVPVRILSADPVVTVSVAPYAQVYPGLQTTLTGSSVPPPTASATYAWYFNGDSIPGAHATTLQVGAEGIGEYTFEITDSTICSGKVTGTAVVKDSLTTTLFIYPNPNNGIFQVRFDNGANDLLSKPKVLTIYDSKGSRVFTKQYVSNVPYGRMDVDLSKLAKGVYVIDLTDSNGNRLQAERVVIH